ncbi:hypothetical protein FQA39_LY19084 [Lamprigera yunnana]|nr:hypothetical protein FQA39_LY19084 [Lamprigera yunnana]
MDVIVDASSQITRSYLIREGANLNLSFKTVLAFIAGSAISFWKFIGGSLTCNRKNGTCGCYLLGTVSSIEGESIYDEKSLKCECLPNVMGIDCDQCVANYYGIISGNGCSPCLCDTSGSVSTQCDLVTGQCSCKDGFVGFRCDQCDLHRYKIAHNCIHCNCNTYGSENLQCNEIGYCTCRNSAEGKLCDQCKRNTHNITQGCISCPSCYGLVQDSSDNLVKIFDKSDLLLHKFEKNLSLIIADFENFIEELKVLTAKLDELKKSDNISAPGNFDELFLDVERRIISFQIQVKEKLTRVLSLENEKDLLRECENVLSTAIERSKQLTIHNDTITDMAKNASAIINNLNERVEEFAIAAKEIQTLIEGVCDTAKKFEDKQQLVATEAINLDSSVKKTKIETVSMKAYVQTLSVETKETLNEALILKEKSNQFEITQDGNTSMGVVIIEADSLVVNKFVTEIKETTLELNETLTSSCKYLGKVQTKQLRLENDLVMLHQYDARATSAVDDTTELYLNQQKTLNKLNEYKELEGIIRGLMTKVPNIEEKIEMVRNNSRNVKFIHEELLDIIRASNILKKTVDGRLKIIEGKNDLILSSFEKVDELEDKRQEISVRLEKLHEELKNVRNNLDLLKGVEKEMETKVKQIKEYSLIYNTLPLDKESLDSVEKEVVTLENMLKIVDDYTYEKDALKKEVANVKDIVESLPIDDKTLCEAPESEPKLGS